MKERTIYIADDGTEFDVFEACVLYESKLENNKQRFIDWYNKDTYGQQFSAVCMIAWLRDNEDKIRWILRNDAAMVYLALNR
jgi:hypothetical protein